MRVRSGAVEDRCRLYLSGEGWVRCTLVMSGVGGVRCMYIGYVWGGWG